jgi:hypothetical protein
MASPKAIYRPQAAAISLFIVSYINISGDFYFASSVAVEGSATLASLKIKARHFLHGTQVVPSMPLGSELLHLLPCLCEPDEGNHLHHEALAGNHTTLQ